jgi:hypothetical protein
LPADYTFQSSDRGQVTFSGATALYTTGTWDVTVTDTSSGITGVAFVTVQAAPVSQFVVTTDADDPDTAVGPGERPIDRSSLVRRQSFGLCLGENLLLPTVQLGIDAVAKVVQACSRRLQAE